MKGIFPSPINGFVKSLKVSGTLKAIDAEGKLYFSKEDENLNLVIYSLFIDQ